MLKDRCRSFTMMATCFIEFLFSVFPARRLRKIVLVSGWSISILLVFVPGAKAVFPTSWLAPRPAASTSGRPSASSSGTAFSSALFSPSTRPHHVDGGSTRLHEDLCIPVLFCTTGAPVLVEDAADPPSSSDKNNNCRVHAGLDAEQLHQAARGAVPISSTTLGELKKKIEAKTGVPATRTRLLLAGKDGVVLRDDDDGVFQESSSTTSMRTNVADDWTIARWIREAQGRSSNAEDDRGRRRSQPAVMLQENHQEIMGGDEEQLSFRPQDGGVGSSRAARGRGSRAAEGRGGNNSRVYSHASEDDDTDTSSPPDAAGCRLLDYSHCIHDHPLRSRETARPAPAGASTVGSSTPYPRSVHDPRGWPRPTAAFSFLTRNRSNRLRAGASRLEAGEENAEDDNAQPSSCAGLFLFGSCATPMEGVSSSETAQAEMISASQELFPRRRPPPTFVPPLPTTQDWAIQVIFRKNLVDQLAFALIEAVEQERESVGTSFGSRNVPAQKLFQRTFFPLVFDGILRHASLAQLRADVAELQSASARAHEKMKEWHRRRSAKLGGCCCSSDSALSAVAFRKLLQRFRLTTRGYGIFATDLATSRERSKHIPNTSLHHLFDSCWDHNANQGTKFWWNTSENAMDYESDEDQEEEQVRKVPKEEPTDTTHQCDTGGPRATASSAGGPQAGLQLSSSARAGAAEASDAMDNAARVQMQQKNPRTTGSGSATTEVENGVHAAEVDVDVDVEDDSDSEEAALQQLWSEAQALKRKSYMIIDPVVVLGSEAFFHHFLSEILPTAMQTVEQDDSVLSDGDTGAESETHSREDRPGPPPRSSTSTGESVGDARNHGNALRQGQRTVNTSPFTVAWETDRSLHLTPTRVTIPLKDFMRYGRAAACSSTTSGLETAMCSYDFFQYHTQSRFLVSRRGPSEQGQHEATGASTRAGAGIFTAQGGEAEPEALRDAEEQQQQAQQIPFLRQHFNPDPNVLEKYSVNIQVNSCFFDLFLMGSGKEPDEYFKVVLRGYVPVDQSKVEYECL
ncbi:unnamed protein product [Amoebophrya sp. A120]|nr:unnamed protein product [Amoebophrya sp. A120]|eukprot:GSA120T00017074001.1